MRFLVFALVFHCSLVAIGQQKHFIEDIGWRGNKIELHTVCNKKKDQSCTFAVNSDSIRAFVFNRQVQLIRQFSMAHPSGEKVLGGFIRDSMVYLYTEKPGSDQLHNWVFDIASGKIKERVVAFDLKKETVVDHISAGDRFLYFTANYKTSAFNIYNFTSDQQWDTLRYTFAESGWNDLTSLHGGSRLVSVEKVDLEGGSSINTAAKGNKLYPRNDTLLLVMNNHCDSTHVYCFDLDNKKVNSWVIQHHTGIVAATNRPHSYSDNSYLLKNKLYYVLATADSLYLQVVDLYTGAINRSFGAKSEDEISFKNTPIVLADEGQYSFGASREPVKTKQLLLKMVNGDAVITATLNNNNQVEVIVGSFLKINQVVSGGYMTRMDGFNSNGWVKSAHFKTLLNASTFEHVDGNIGNSINEKVGYYTTGIKIPPQAENLFMSGGRYYHAYYNKDDRRLVILQF